MTVKIKKQLIKMLGADNVSEDASTRDLLSDDLFPNENRIVAGAIAAPKSTEEVAACVKLAKSSGLAIAPRGGGMSYTGGYRSGSVETLLLDLQGLNAVREINREDRYVIVEAGCNWAKLKEAFEGSGLRPVMRGPISGAISTIGGAASQNLPGSMDAILGLEVVTAAGEIVRTGSYGANKGGFYRNFGPDLTGLFLGDCGAMGIKTAVVIRLEPWPDGVAHASYGFQTMADTVDAMTRIAALGLGGRVMALDPLKNKTSTKVSMKEGVDTLKSVVSTGGLKRGLKDAAKIAMAGKKVYDDVPWSLHLTYEAASDRGAQDALAKAKKICNENGSEVEPSVPIAMYAGNYSIRGFLGIKGERWAPIHSVFPLSKTAEVVKTVEAFFADYADDLAKHDIIHSFIMSANGPYFLIEPMFYWPDKILDLHKANLEDRRVKKMTPFEDNPEARAWVRQAREELRDILYGMGGVSAQIGRFYPYADSMSGETMAFLKQLRSALDSDNTLNPGVLGL